MKIGEILKDSLRYPFSDWKKFLILGVIVLMGILFVQFSRILGSLAIIFVILGFLIQILEYGYWFRIIKSSLDGLIEPPEFNDWRNMFKEGIRMFIVIFVYLIPASLIIALTGILSVSFFGIFIAILYIILILPIMVIELVQLANKNKGMFEFHELLNKINILGWKKFIKWYLATGIIFLIIITLGISAVTILEKFTYSIIGTILLLLIITPYISMYFSRSIGLLFMTK